MENLTLAPYYLKRICSKPRFFEEKLLSKIIDASNQIGLEIGLLEKSLEKLDLSIYSDIGKLSGDKRKKAINIRRDVRKKQLKKSFLEHLDIFSENTQSLFKESFKIFEYIETLKEKKEIVLKQSKEAAYSNLIEEVEKNSLFRNALMISMNSELYGNIDLLKGQKSFPTSKKLKDTIFSIKNYLNRMIHKPSPFSTFVGVKIGIYGGSEEKKEPERSRVCVNILFLHILESLLLLDNNEFVSDLYVKVNPTAILKDGNIEFLKVETSNPKYMYYKENITEIKSTRHIDLVLKKSGNKNHHLLTLANELALEKTCFEKMEQAVVFLLKLAKVGLLYKNFNIDSAKEDHLEKLIALCDGRKNPKYFEINKRLKNIKRDMKIINNDYLNVDRKKKLRDAIYSQIKMIFLMYSIKASDLNFKAHNIIFENYISPNIERSKPPLEEKNIKKFDYIAKIYRIFDNNYITKIIYRDIFLKKYGADSKVRLLEFYKDVENFHNEREIVENDSSIKQIGRMREDFFDILNSGLKNDYISISPQQVEKIYDGAPRMMKIPKSYGIYYQKCSDGLVINNTAPGFGRHFMRYADGLKREEAKKFIDCYKNNLKVLNFSNLYDIGTNLGLNINKHIPCLDRKIPYPQSIYMDGDINVENEEYFVEYDEKYDRLCVCDGDDREIEITPIGFIFSRVAPGYYRFLSAFSNSQGAEISFWDRFSSCFKSQDRAAFYPRVVFDQDVILERKTWKIPCDFLQGDGRFEADEYIKLVDYFEKNKIPKRFFSKISVDIDGILVKNKDIKNWMKEISNKRLRKPQFFDLNNYIDFRNLLKMVNSGNDIITISEALPDGDEIVEYLVELNEVDVG